VTRIDLDQLQDRLGYRFRQPDLLDLALTHRSHGHESGRPHRNNEILEFLGDAILGFVIADALRREAPLAEVGHLTRRRAYLVSEVALAPRADRLGLGAALRLGKGEDSSGGREKPSLLADAFEAVVAAIYLDGGMGEARDFILRQFPGGRETSPSSEMGDPKTRLQELLQARGEGLPEYRLTSQSGPDHDRSFTVELVIGGRSVATGEGRTKKAAGAEAARIALARLEPTAGPTAGGGPRRPAGGKG
jgi:ribonuclease-3